MIRNLTALLACGVLLALSTGAALGAKPAPPKAGPDCAKLLTAAAASTIVGQHVTLVRYDAGATCLYNADALVGGSTSKEVFIYIIKPDGGVWYRRASAKGVAFVQRCQATGSTTCPITQSFGLGSESLSTGVENYLLVGKTSLGLETMQNSPALGGGSVLTFEQVQALFKKVLGGLK
jgi:hypothetical protein